MPTYVTAYDAETGEFQWTFLGPSLRSRDGGSHQAANDDEAIKQRGVSLNEKYYALAPPWSYPTITADGTILIGNQDGQFYSIRRVEGDLDTPPCSLRYTGVWSGTLPAIRGHLHVTSFDMK